MSDRKYRYDERVNGEIKEDRINDYIKIAQKLNNNDDAN
jgi:hypothetical protein